MANPVIVEAVRTPIGKRNGWLSGPRSTDLLGAAQVELVKRAGIDPASVEQIVGGCVTQVGEQGFNVTRTAWLSQSLPYEIGGHHHRLPVRLVAAGQQLREQPHRGGRHRRGIGCGVEAMSRVGRAGPSVAGAGKAIPVDLPYDMPDQFTAAERIAKKYGITRARRRRARPRLAAEGRVAVAEDRFAREIVPVEAPIVGEEGPMGRALGRKIVVTQGPGSRETTAEGLAKLKPVLPDGMHTAGNSSQISDGVAAVLWMSEERAKAEGLRPGPASWPRRWSARTPTTTSTAPSRRRPRCSRRPG